MDAATFDANATNPNADTFAVCLTMGDLNTFIYPRQLFLFVYVVYFFYRLRRLMPMQLLQLRSLNSSRMRLMSLYCLALCWWPWLWCRRWLVLPSWLPLHWCENLYNIYLMLWLYYVVFKLHCLTFFVVFWFQTIYNRRLKEQVDNYALVVYQVGFSHNVSCVPYFILLNDNTFFRATLVPLRCQFPMLEPFKCKRYSVVEGALRRARRHVQGCHNEQQ